MRKNKTRQRLAAMMLSVIMVVGMMPVSALAKTGSFPIGASGEVTAFEALGADIAAQGVPLGTSEADLELPDTLTATVRLAVLEEELVMDSEEADSEPDSDVVVDTVYGTMSNADAVSGSAIDADETEDFESNVDSMDEITIPLPVTWASSPEYDGEAVGTYVFMPELPEGFILTDGVELPAITVTVSEGEALVYAVRGTSISLSNGTEYPETVEGLGTEEDPLCIETAAQLAALAWSVNHGSLPDSLPEYPYLILVNDLDLSDYDENEDEYGKGWVPIGGYYNEETKTYAFSGTFDGNHKTIRGLYVERDARYVGLFGYIKEGTVKNLTVEDGDVTGYAATGGIVGNLYNGRLENCAFSGSVTGEDSTGGIVGDLGASKVEDCKNTGSITGKTATGGIVGGAGSDAENDYLRNCINAGPVTGADAFTGGITGILVDMLADYCVNTGTVQGGTDLNTGGVAGTIFEGIIQNCVNGGPTSGSANNVGGVAGSVSASTIQNCVNYADIWGEANSVGGVAGFAEDGSAVINCLTTGDIRGKVNIIEPGGVSGVVGRLQKGSGSANTLSGCIALGQTVIKDGEMGHVARIAARTPDDEAFDNFAWKGMRLFWDDELIPEEDYTPFENGEDADVPTLYLLWTTGALAESWSDAGVWTLAEGKLPVLTGLPHQSDEFPSHISGIAGVIVSPDSASVQKGTTKSFTAAVTGIGAIDDTVTWSVSGATHAGTIIDSTGILTVAADETAAALIVTATATGDSSKKGTASVTVTDPSTIKYNLTVNSGSGSGEYAEGENVTITAAAPAENKLFDRWIVTSGTLDLSNATANPITIRMPAEAIIIGATYKDKPAVPDPTYIVTLNSGALGATGSGSYTEGTTVNIYAGTRGDYTFAGWSSPDVTITSASSKNASFVMPGKAVTVTANWSYNGGGGSGGGSGDSGGGYTPTPIIPTDKQPDMPTVAKPSVSGMVKEGILSTTITEQMVKDALKATQDAAKKSGKELDGIALDFNVTGSGSYTNLNATIDAGAIDRLKESGVKFIKIGSAVLDVTLDMGAIAEIDKQTSGTVAVSAKKITKLSDAAKKLIGNRSVFDITVSYQKNGKTEYVSDFGKGAVTLGIAYKATDKESKGNLFGVYVDKNGKPQLLANSSYDNNGRLIFSRNTLSTYGVGYKAPSPAFTDTAKHWAKDNIDFVASRDLISGTTATTFAPNTAITRATFLMALGKLSGADVSSYIVSSFTDVKSTDTAMPYIEWAVKNKIVSGNGNGKFGPNDSITREQMTVMMVGYAKATGYKLPVSKQAITFADNAKISTYAKDAVKAIQQTGVINGKDNNRFDPQGNATRAEASTILRRFVELVIDEGTARGWVQNDAGQWQYIGENGKPVVGWLTAENGKYRYYFTADGIMASGKWLQIDGKWYYFNADGSLAKSTKVGEYEVDENGVRKTK